MDKILSSGNIKREILANSDITGIRKRMQGKMTSDQEGTYVAMGEALEGLTQHKGWAYLEAYMMKFIMGSLLSDDNKDITKGFVNIMHYIDQIVRFKNDILEKREE